MTVPFQGDALRTIDPVPSPLATLWPGVGRKMRREGERDVIYSSTQFYISIVKRITRAVPRSLDRIRQWRRIEVNLRFEIFMPGPAPFRHPAK